MTQLRAQLHNQPFYRTNVRFVEPNEKQYYIVQLKLLFLFLRPSSNLYALTWLKYSRWSLIITCCVIISYVTSTISVSEAQSLRTHEATPLARYDPETDRIGAEANPGKSRPALQVWGWIARYQFDL